MAASSAKDHSRKDARATARARVDRQDRSRTLAPENSPPIPCGHPASPPVGSGLARAMKKHQRIFLNHALRTKDLDIHLPSHHFMAWTASVLAANVEIVPR